LSYNTILATAPLTATGYHLKATGTALGQSLIYDDGTNVGIRTATPANTLDVIRGTAGAMGRGVYESASFSFNGDMKFGLYTSAAAGLGGASLIFGATNFTAAGNYPGFELQFSPSATLASNYIRFNSVGRDATGTVVTATSDILCIFQSANVVVGSGTDSGFRFDVNGTTRITGQLTLGSTITNGTYTYTLPSATGTLALTSALSGYLPLTGGTLTGALGGTSAAFSSGATFGSTVRPITNFAADLGTSSFRWAEIFGYSINLTNNATISGTLGVTGAATFSSSVTATNGNFSLPTVGGVIGSVKNLTVSYFNGAIGDWAGLNFAYFNNSTNFAYIGSVLTNVNVNAAADLVFGTKASNAATSVTEYMRITSGGNVGIGTGASVSAYGFFGVAGSVTVSSLTGVVAGFSDALYGTTRLYVKNGVNGINTDQAFEISTGGGSPTPRLTIASTGNVGIGTTSPVTRLSLGDYSGSRLPYINGTTNTFSSNGITVSSANSGSAAIGGGLDLTNNTYSVGSYSPIISFSSLSSSGSYNNSYAGIWGIMQGAGGDSNWNRGDLVFGTANTYGIVEKMRITGAGIVDITGPLVIRGVLPADQTDAAVIDHFSTTMRIFSYGTSGVTGDFQFRTAAGGAGSNLVSTINGTTGVYVAVSNINRKKDFEESTIGLNEILGLKPTLYRMKDDDELANKELGFIAQEVKEFIPQAYVESGKDENKFIGLNYQAITTALVKAVQELSAQIKELQSQINK